MSDAGLWRYRAALRRVKDGDTIEVTLDLGFGVGFLGMALRLLGLNAADRDQPAAAARATAFAEDWLRPPTGPAPAWPLLVETSKNDQPDKYGGRWLARVYRDDGRCLNDDILAAGLARPWDGQGVKPT